MPAAANSLYKPGSQHNRLSGLATRLALSAVRLTELKSRRAVHAILEVMEDPAAPHSARLRAAELILDRALGKARQSVDLAGGVSLRIELVDPTAGATTTPATGPTLEARIVPDASENPGACGDASIFHNTPYAPSADANILDDAQPQDAGDAALDDLTNAQVEAEIEGMLPDQDERAWDAAYRAAWQRNRYLDRKARKRQAPKA